MLRVTSTDHLVASAHENGDCPGVRTLLNNEHLVARGAEGEFAHNAGMAQLLRRQLFESWYDTAVCRNRNELVAAFSGYLHWHM